MLRTPSSDGLYPLCPSRIGARPRAQTPGVAPARRFGEATGDTGGTFGNVPCVNFMGDLGQLPAMGTTGLHSEPEEGAGPAAIAGQTTYRNFNDVVRSPTVCTPRSSALSQRRLRGPHPTPAADRPRRDNAAVPGRGRPAAAAAAYSQRDGHAAGLAGPARTRTDQTRRGASRPRAPGCGGRGWLAGVCRPTVPCTPR